MLGYHLGLASRNNAGVTLWGGWQWGNMRSDSGRWCWGITLWWHHGVTQGWHCWGDAGEWHWDDTEKWCWGITWAVTWGRDAGWDWGDAGVGTPEWHWGDMALMLGGGDAAGVTPESMWLCSSDVGVWCWDINRVDIREWHWGDIAGGDFGVPLGFNMKEWCWVDSVGVTWKVDIGEWLWHWVDAGGWCWDDREVRLRSNVEGVMLEHCWGGDIRKCWGWFLAWNREGLGLEFGGK